MRRVFLSLFRFSTNQSITTKQQGSLTTAQQKFAQTPIHLRPYDKAKYEVPMKKIKKNSGYALLQIEPFPRARIMRICYNILQKVKIGIPQDFLERIFIQQRTKYIMELTDKTQDVQELENLFGTDSIQLFIQALSGHIQYIQLMRKHKFWLQKSDASFLQKIKDAKVYQSRKFPIYKKGERPTNKLLDL